MSGLLRSFFGGRTYGKSYTLNFDGSHNNQENKSGAGCVIRDGLGDLVVAAAYNLTATYPKDCNVAIAEAEALLKGLELAKNHNVTLNLIEGDSKEVIDHVLGRSRRSPGPPLSVIIEQIIGMIDHVSQEIVIIDRGANQVAHTLANWGSKRLNKGACEIYRTDGDLPPQVVQLLRQGQNRSFSVRNEVADGEGSSMAGTLGKIGAVLTGAALLYGAINEIMSDESSSDIQQHKNKGKAPQTRGSSIPNNAYKRHQYDDQYTLHYSGSDINQRHNGGAGCIIRNKQGDLVIAASYNLDNLYLDRFHVAIGEAIAWRNGLKLANNKNIKLNRVMGDNNEVIDRVLGLEKAPGDPSLNKIVGEIREALREQSIDPITQVIHIRKQANKVANKLAYLGSNNLKYGVAKIYVRDDDLLHEVAQLIQEDKMNWD